MEVFDPDAPQGVNTPPAGSAPRVPENVYDPDNPAFSSQVRGAIPSGDLPEITSQTEIPYYQRFGTDLKLTFTSEPWEKARIIAKSFPDRVELLMDDKTGEPVVSIDGNPYLVNKQGASAQDLNDLVAETGYYLIPSILSGGASLLGRLGLGALTYGVTEAGREAATTAAGGKAAGDPLIDMGDVGATSVTGAVTEAFVPPLVRAGGRGLRKIWSANRGGQQALDAIITAAAAGDAEGLQRALRLAGNEPRDGAIPLTRGQATGSRQDIETEAMMRESTGAYGQRATDVVRDFDNQQMGAIEREAAALQERVGAGSGFAEDTPYTIGSRVQGDVQAAESAARATADEAQEAAKAAKRESRAFFDADTFKAGLDDLINSARDMGIGGMTLRGMNGPNEVISRLRRFRTGLKEGRLKRADYSAIHDFRRDLGTRARQAGPGTPEQALFLEMQGRLDRMVEEALTDGLVQGDPATIKMVQEADAIWRDYKNKFFPRRPDRFGNRDAGGAAMMRILGDTPPEQVFQMIANIGRNAPKKETIDILNRMKGIFGENSEQIRLLKDAAIYKMFTNTNKGKAEITRSTIVKNYFDFFHKNKTLADQLFTAEERDAIRRFAGQVARTMPAEIRLNPSGTGAFLARMLRDVSSGGLVARITSAAADLPVVGNAGGGNYARTLTYFDRLTSGPFAAPVVAATDRSEGTLPRESAEAIGFGIKAAIPPYGE